jgi:hypothetical protein
MHAKRVPGSSEETVPLGSELDTWCPEKLTEVMTGRSPNSGSSSACQETLSFPLR